MIYTSYYEQINNLPDSVIPVAISAEVPDWFNGKTYQRLIPTKEIMQYWLDSKDRGSFYWAYNKLLLLNLDAEEVCRELAELGDGKNVALLTDGKPGDFSHRLFVKEWLNKHCIECCEWQKPNW